MADIKPGNIANNIGNILQAQKEVTKESSTTESVRENLALNNNQSGDKEKSIIFKGFMHKIETQSKSEVLLPITNISVRQTPIIYKEEVNLAQTIIKEEDLFMEVLKLLYSHITEGPQDVLRSFDSFLDNVAEMDVEALLYGFYLISYGPDVKMEDTHVCTACQNKNTIKGFNLVELYKEKAFQGQAGEALKKEHPIKLDDCDLPGVTFWFKFPSLRRATKAKNVSKINFLNEIASSAITNYLSKFTTDVDGVTTDYSDEESVKNAIETLNVKARKKIKKFLQENFFEYGIKFEYVWKCDNMVDDPEAINEKAKKKCDTENKHRYGINNLFFREISESVS